jgi:cobalt/nickel transport system permease protein
MHMADALLSPAVGGTMWAVSAGTLAWCSAKLRQGLDDRKVPLMGVLGAFLFAAQMVSFTIPATGSSGHLGGGLLLAILLGPPAAFIVIASVLVVQALFFADGGLLALGCNMFNMGFIPAFIVYPLIYANILGDRPGRFRMTMAIMASAIATLQLGPLCVVLETWYSGIAALPFVTFLLLMLPVHLAIGIVEGFVTVAIISFVRSARPDIVREGGGALPADSLPARTVPAAFLVAALLLGGVVSWTASKNPDGLEWAIRKATGRQGLQNPDQRLHRALAALQGGTAFLPDYAFGKPAASAALPEADKGGEGSRPGTSLSGLIGGMLTLVLVCIGGFFMRRRSPGAPTVAGEHDGDH